MVEPREELATSEGFPTNALLGFANMLFKLLVDYQPKGVAVAWDTRPVCINWMNIFAPLACTASVTRFHPATCAAENIPGMRG